MCIRDSGRIGHEREIRRTVGKQTGSLVHTTKVLVKHKNGNWRETIRVKKGSNIYVDHIIINVNYDYNKDINWKGQNKSLLRVADTQSKTSGPQKEIS